LKPNQINFKGIDLIHEKEEIEFVETTNNFDQQINQNNQKELLESNEHDNWFYDSLRIKTIIYGLFVLGWIILFGICLYISCKCKSVFAKFKKQTPMSTSHTTEVIKSDNIELSPIENQKSIIGSMNEEKQSLIVQNKTKQKKKQDIVNILVPGELM
jgi:hypothetical protein